MFLRVPVCPTFTLEEPAPASTICVLPFRVWAQSAFRPLLYTESLLLACPPDLITKSQKNPIATYYSTAVMRLSHHLPVIPLLSQHCSSAWTSNSSLLLLCYVCLVRWSRNLASVAQKSLAFRVVCLKSHPPLFVHPWPASVRRSSLSMTRALIFSEFLQRLQVPAPHFPGGIWSARIFPMQVSTCSVLLSSGEAPPSPQRQERPQVLCSSIPGQQQPLSVCNLGQGLQHTKDIQGGVLRPPLYALQASAGKCKQRWSVSPLY